MKDVFTFYKAVDPIKGSWDGYGYFTSGEQDFVAFVADAPSGASIHTPECIKKFWLDFATTYKSSGLPAIELADALNRLQNQLQQQGRSDNVLYQATIAFARKFGSKLFYCCIGDSALQICRNGKLYRLSESEIWDGSLIVESEQQTQDRQKTRDLRFIGSNGSFIQISEIGSVELKDQDLVLLHTDGIEDLIPPDHLLKILTASTEDLRKQLDKTFAPDRIKDDATMIAVPVRIAPSFHVEKEFAQLRNQLEQIQKDQANLRKQLQDLSATASRLNKLEASVQQVSQNAQRLNQRPQSTPSNRTSGKQPVRLWLIILLCLVLGAAAGALFFRGAKTKPVETSTQVKPAPKRAIEPPEIPSEQNCSYTVQKGDSLDKIASSRSLSVDQLLKLNPSHKRETALKIGQILVVCGEDAP